MCLGSCKMGTRRLEAQGQPCGSSTDPHPFRFRFSQIQPRFHRLRRWLQVPDSLFTAWALRKPTSWTLGTWTRRLHHGWMPKRLTSKDRPSSHDPPPEVSSGKRWFRRSPATERHSGPPALRVRVRGRTAPHRHCGPSDIVRVTPGVG